MLGRLDVVVVSLQEVWRGWLCRRNSWKTEVTRDQVNCWVTDNDGELRGGGQPRRDMNDV